MSVSLVDLITARRIIQSYKQTYSRYYTDEGAQQGHYVFALHAAFPLYFTPDLLYRLWQNFQTYHWQGKIYEVDPIAVSDFILSGMARETGYHLYEMAPGVRDLLLQELTAFSDGEAPLFTVERLHDIARFVQAYNEKNHLNPTQRSLYTALKWTAQSVLDPSFAAKSMAMALSESLQTSNEGETLRIAMLLDNFRQKGNAFDQVAQLSTAVQNKLLNKPMEQVVLRYSNGDEGNVEVVLPEGILDGKLRLVKHEKKVNKPNLYAVLIGIDRYAIIPPYTLHGCANDAYAVDAYLKSIKTDFGWYDPHILINEQASRASVINAFQHFKRAQSGDVCLFYFAGYGSSARTDLFDVPEGELTTLVCHDSRSEGVFDLDSTEFNSLLYEVLEGKPDLNFTIILDCSFYTNTTREEQFPHRSLPMFPSRRQIEHYYGFDKDLYQYNPDTEQYTPPSIQKPYLLLSACRSYEKAYETVNSNSKTVGLFTDTLLEILRENGRNITYSDLIHRIKLRISSQRQLSQVPNLISNGPSNLEGLLFLSEKQPSQTIYQIAYYADKTKQEWRLLAGARQGIRPSINFMFTYLTVNELNGQKAIVKDVFEDYSTLLDFDEKDIDKTFTATLAQNALPKVKIAFDEKLEPDMRKAFEAAVARHDIYYIDLIEKIHEARYLICNREHEYYLACNSTDQQGAYLPVAPIFIYVRDPFDFIKQLEYIAQWRGLLEYDQSLTPTQRSQVALSFEVIEGVTLNASNLDTVEGKWIGKPEVLELSYRQSQQPAFRCKVEAVRDEVYVSALFLSTSFGIQSLNKNHLLQASGPTVKSTATDENSMFIEFALPAESTQNEQERYENSIFRELVSRDRTYKTVPIRMGKIFIENNVKETYDFLKIFLSDKPIDLTPLLQEHITFNERELTRSLGLESSRAAFDLSGIHWTSITIPIKVVNDEKKANQLLEDIKSELLEEKPNSIFLKTLKQHKEWVMGIAFSPDGNYLATGGWDGSAIIWDWKNGRLLTILDDGHNNKISNVAYSSDGKHLTIVSNDRTARIWALDTQRQLIRFIADGVPDDSLALSPDGKHLATTSGVVFEVESSKLLIKIKKESGQKFLKIAFSIDGKRLVTGGIDNILQIWDLRNGELLTTIKGHEKAIDCISFSPTRETIAVGYRDYTAKIWDIENGIELCSLNGHTREIRSIVFSPGGTLIATGSQDRTAKIWDSDTGKLLSTLNGHLEGVWCVAFSPDGSRVATGSQDCTAKVWDISNCVTIQLRNILIEKQVILFLTANPTQTSTLRLDKDIRRIQGNLAQTKWRDSFNLVSEEGVKVSTIIGAIQKNKPTIVHFSGHGTEGIMIENEEGQAEFFPTEGLTQLFKLFENQVKCVVLDSCYSKIQAREISKLGIYVVGINNSIRDETSTAFAVGFYQSLGEGNSFEFAYKIAMVNILVNRKDANTPEIWLNGVTI